MPTGGVDQIEGGELITMRVAGQIEKVLTYAPEGALVQPRYSFCV